MIKVERGLSPWTLAVSSPSKMESDTVLSVFPPYGRIFHFGGTMIRQQLTLGDVSRQVGVGPWTIRRLERLGRIPPARRDPIANNSRIYSVHDAEVIRAALASLQSSGRVGDERAVS
jgi:hypothetical protein